MRIILLMTFAAASVAVAKTSHDKMRACVGALNRQATESSTLAIYQIILGQRNRFGEYLHRYVVAGRADDSGRTIYALIPMGRDPTADTAQPRMVFAEQMAFFQFSEDEYAQLKRDSRQIGTVDVTPLEIDEPPHEELTSDNTPLGTVIRVGPALYVVVRKELARTREPVTVTSERLGLLPLREDFTPASMEISHLRLAGMSDYVMASRVFRDLPRLGHGILHLNTTIENGVETITEAKFQFTGRAVIGQTGVVLRLKDLKFN